MTTDNLPAIVEPTREIGRADTDSWIGVASDVIKLATLIAPTEFVPRQLRDSAPATAAAILYGREVGLAPMTALTMTHVIEGKPAMSAEAMRGLVMAAGHELHFDESTGARCVVRARRFGFERWTVLEWTIDQARAAGLLGKDNWKKYPRAMLVARATADIARMVFPDVIHGFRAVEEFDDVLDEAAPEQVESTTRVTRATKKAAAKKAAAPLQLAERPARPEPSGPPLPGEDGYDQPPAAQTTDTAAAVSTDGSDLPGGQDGSTDEDPGEDEGEASGPGDSEGEGGEQPARGGPTAPPPPRLLNRAQQRGIEAALTSLGVDNDREERHLIASTILGRPVESMKDVTFDEASTLMDTFARVDSKEQLTALLDAADAERKERERVEIQHWNAGDRS